MNIIDESVLESSLNIIQKNAVLNHQNPQLILAGAGSGKTRVVTYKIAHLVSKYDIPAYRILAVTFTNKAAGEMKERLGKLLGADLPFDWMGTFHSICVRVLRYSLPSQPDKTLGLGNLTSAFSIYDDADQKRAIKEIYKRKDAEVEASLIKRARAYISNCKNKNIEPDAAVSKAIYQEQKELAQVYFEYQNFLKENNALDFDDLLSHTVKFLKKNDQARLAYQQRFEYFFVDEYQDTNPVQFELIKLLTGGQMPSPKVTVVGDDDQSIYGWRGADISIIRRFSADFQNVEIVKLVQNYRSTSNIVRGANSVVKNNPKSKEFEKDVFSKNEAGEPIKIIRVRDERDEAKNIVASVKLLGESKYNDVAVFYRTNSQSRILEEAFNSAKIPVILIGGTRFYDRKEVKDIFAYLRVLVNPLDEMGLLRIINTPKRGIGDTTVEKLQRAAQEFNLTLFEAMTQCQQFIPTAGVVTKVTGFVNMIENLRAGLEEDSLPIIVEKTISQSGYKQALVDENTTESEDRLANLDELLNAVVEADEKNPDLTLDQYLQEVSLLTSVDLAAESTQAIKMMTLHGAKGLEFPYVFIAGVDERLLPMSRGENPDEDIEEERRLFYVGMTRAQTELTLFSAQFRRLHGREEIFEQSRFIKEIESEVKEELNFVPQMPMGSTSGSSWGGSGGYGGERSGNFYGKGIRMPSRGSKSTSSSRPATVRSRLKTEGESSYIGKKLKAKSQPEVDEFSQENVYLDVGSKVAHAKFGVGVIKSCNGTGDNAKLEIKFNDGSTRKLLMKFAKLKPL